MRALQPTFGCLLALVFAGSPALAQNPLAKPLAEFDKLAAQLRSGSVVGEPIRAGDTAVIPFAKIQFALGGGEMMAGLGGGMGGKAVPMGVLIIEGDEVRTELFPEPVEKPSLLHEVLQSILDRKVVFMGNGVNIGHTTGTIQDLAPLVSAMMGQTTVMGQVFNVGSLNPPSSATRGSEGASVEEVSKLFRAAKYNEALAMADTLIGKDPKSADLHGWRGRILTSLAATDPAEMRRYGAIAGEEFEKALALDPKNRNALVGRGIGRLMFPAAYGGNVDAAIADFEAAIAVKATAPAYYYLGEALRAKGQNDKAAGAYRKALELDPHHADAMKALAALQETM